MFRISLSFYRKKKPLLGFEGKDVKPVSIRVGGTDVLTVLSLLIPGGSPVR